MIYLFLQCIWKNEHFENKNHKNNIFNLLNILNAYPLPTSHTLRCLVTRFNQSRGGTRRNVHLSTNEHYVCPLSRPASFWILRIKSDILFLFIIYLLQYLPNICLCIRGSHPQCLFVYVVPHQVLNRAFPHSFFTIFYMSVEGEKGNSNK